MSTAHARRLPADIRRRRPSSRNSTKRRPEHRVCEAATDRSVDLRRLAQILFRHINIATRSMEGRANAASMEAASEL